ncbi:MAG: hypothetical protein KI785_07745 [Devosiaceae bacterium]|nr:hypothetical protein [Devosiaceae bacterium MH13]
MTSPRTSSPEVTSSHTPSAGLAKARFFNAPLKAVAVAGLMAGALVALAPAPAHAVEDLTCGPEHSTVEAVRSSLSTEAPALLDLNITETDLYLAQLGFGRPANSYGKASVIVIVPNRGALLGMTDGQNMCSPFLRVTARDHETAIDAARGMSI